MDIILLIFSVVWFGAVVWLIRRALSQRGAFLQAAPRSVDRATAPHVAVIIPARDECDNIGPCVRSIMAEDYPPDRLHIIVINDESTDGTEQIVAKLAQADPRIALLSTPPLPPGWKGKVNACCTGLRAVPADVEWLCFLDADMRAEPQAIASSVRTAIDGRLDLLSLAPRHELRSFAERLMLPCGHYLLAFTQDLSRLQAPESKDAVATGQFMLMRRTAYDNAGGHAAVCTEICEDVQLARLMKRHGYRVVLYDGSRLVSTRMYTGWRTLWPGIAKNLTEMLGGPLPTVGTAIAALMIAWGAVLLPALDLYACAQGAGIACVAVIPALLGALALIGLHIFGARHFKIPIWYGFLFPFGYTAGAVIALDSLRWRLTGRVRWKGRVYQ